MLVAAVTLTLLQTAVSLLPQRRLSVHALGSSRALAVLPSLRKDARRCALSALRNARGSSSSPSDGALSRAARRAARESRTRFGLRIELVGWVTRKTRPRG